MMKCKCGHDISDHDTGYGCLADTDDRHVCKCNNEKDVIYQDYIAALLAAGNAMQALAYNFKSVATFRETDGNCYHCGANETQTHSPKCQFAILQNELSAALEAWENVTK
jgi:hypothetical protein